MTEKVDLEKIAFDKLTGHCKHYCPDWDGLAIDETCPEFGSCHCEFTPRQAPEESEE